MRIVADQDIVALDGHFSRYGELVKLPGRQIVPAAVKQAEVLLVRSVTRVDAGLLEDSAVRFVASATSGTDHVDIGWLQRQGIGFASAPGANANAVVEYCLAALAELSRSLDLDPGRRSAGIVGAGHVGGRLARLLLQLGYRVHVCDPLLDTAAREQLLRAGVNFSHFPDILQHDIVSLHVPLVRGGSHNTYHMVGRKALEQMRPETILLNTSRGAVVDNLALAEALAGGQRLHAVLDVWESEPEPDLHLLARTRLATPHIAGYSLESKLRATALVASAMGSFFGIFAEPPAPLAALPQHPLAVPQSVTPPLYPELLAQMHPLHQLDATCRNWQPSDLPEGFDRCRAGMVNRREFSGYACGQENLPDELHRFLSLLGVVVGR